jgi:hypothetical protein
MGWIDEVYDKEFFLKLLDFSRPKDDPLPRAPWSFARASSFRKIFQNLINLEKDYYHIVETGSIRGWDQWGDGQSTRLFDSFVNYFDGCVTTIDINIKYTELTHNNTSDKVQAINGNSLEILPTIKNCADLLYLDSFDNGPGDELNSSLHHLYELICSKNIIDNNTIIAVDDTDEDGEGKGKYIVEFVQKANFKILVHEGRQFAFKMEKNK